MVSNIIINILYVIISIAFGLFVHKDIIQNDISSYGNIQETYLFIALILLISIGYTLFAFIIIYKTHHYFTFTYPYGYYSRPQKYKSDDSNSDDISVHSKGSSA
uniref:Uncharacterized protein n=1 Tax=Panagrolaimus sp. PS1159 TaxID=55785 RepID=A0AC35F6L0_9BILA